MTRTKLVAVLAICGMFVVIGVLNLRDRLSAPAIADDGVEWVEGANGLQARSISPDSPLRFAIKKGDFVRAVFRVGKPEDGAPGTSAQRHLDYEEGSATTSATRLCITTKCSRTSTVLRNRFTTSTSK